jgi:hypothetical protein
LTIVQVDVWSVLAIQQGDSLESGMTHTAITRPDEALHKGAMEDEATLADGKRCEDEASLGGQLGHRDQDEMLKDNDTDFPEPDAHAEHTGE